LNQIKRSLCILAAASALLTAPLGLVAQAKAGQSYAPGVYVGTAQGIGGEVTVTITVNNKKIMKVEISGDKETPSLGGEAIKKLRAQILKTSGAKVDVVSGATVTSNAVKDALAQALEPAQGKKKSAGIVDGKYVTKAMGHEDYVHVATVFKDGKIASVKVLSHAETMGIGNYAAARVPDRIVAAQSLAVDSVSGATVTSSAVKAAVAQAIKKAGGDLAAFQKAPEAALVVKQAVSQKVDVAIAGAGTAGLIAGARLADQGKKVILFEKQDIPGGALPMTYGGIVSSGTKVGAAYGQGREKNDSSWNKSILLNLLKTIVRPQYDRYNKEMPYKSASLDASGPMVDWLHDIGVGFAPMGKYEGALQLGIEPYLAPGCYQGGSGYLAMYLADHITAKGGTIVYGTPVTGLKIDGKKVVGLMAEGKDGRSWDVSADAVILATGGFASNRDMIAKYYPKYKDFKFNSPAGSTGEGIAMGQAAGAATECFDRDLGAFPAVYGSNYEVAFITITVPGFMVNGDGKSMKETSHVALGNAKLNPENKGRFFYVFDDEGVEAMKKSMKYGFSYASVFERGEAVHYASVDAASKALALPELQATLDQNNKDAAAGKRASYVETREGIWTIRIDPSYYLTTGGLVIDTKAQVLDASGAAIPGLYAAGDVAGSIEEKDGQLYAYGCDAAMTYGFIAAGTVANSLKK
jgi:uncharacterized protein with FMN-binding domain/succinate dehydrogenase/fumarate reductase flavoprotein subunit